MIGAGERAIEGEVTPGGSVSLEGDNDVGPTAGQAIALYAFAWLVARSSILGAD
jgi:hypothetical protein